VTESTDTGTWQYGLVGRWWAEFNPADDSILMFVARRG
jgi:hypothetical protein